MRVWVAAERWEHGLQLAIFDEGGAQLGATQTHDGYPQTPGDMVREYVALTQDVDADTVEAILL